MTIIAIDTSNKTLSVALQTEDGQLFERTIEDTLQHSVKLMPTLQQILYDSQTTMQQVTKIIVAQGPGSYTGLRIGVTVAKTLAKSLQVPLVAVSSLLPLVANAVAVVPEVAYIAPFFDARRNNIFTGLYKLDEQQLQLTVPEQHVSWEQWLLQLEALHQPIYFIGRLQAEQQVLIQERLQNQAIFVADELATPHASSLIQFESEGAVVDADIFVPTYLKLAEAEENWLATHSEKEEFVYVERM